MSKIRTNSKIKWRVLLQGIVMLSVIPGILFIWVGGKLGFGQAFVIMFLVVIGICWTFAAVELIVRGLRR